jgi:hypothetical protein
MRQNLPPLRAWWWYPCKGLLMVFELINKVLQWILHPPKRGKERLYTRSVTYSWVDHFGCQHTRHLEDERPARR